jgi:hypothetical protein
MHQTDYLPLHQDLEPSRRPGATYVIFTHHGRIKFCGVRGKTKSTYFKAVTSPWFL